MKGLFPSANDKSDFIPVDRWLSLRTILLRSGHCDLPIHFISNVYSWIKKKLRSMYIFNFYLDVSSRFRKNLMKIRTLQLIGGAGRGACCLLRTVPPVLVSVFLLSSVTFIVNDIYAFHFYLQGRPSR
jgi:hypothetical protein